MEKLEKVEKLVEKTGVTYEDAKAALEACEWDMLDAVIYLEKLGKVKTPQNGTYNSNYEGSTDNSFNPNMNNAGNNTYNQNNNRTSGGFGDAMSDLGSWVGKVFRKICDSSLKIDTAEDKSYDIPMLIFILLGLFAFWVVFPLMIISLFFGFRYSIKGKLDNKTVNDIMGKAADSANNIKNDFTDGYKNNNNDTNNDTNNYNK